MASHPPLSWSSRLRDRRLARLFALADQGFQGLGSIVASALLGRYLPPDAFGAVGVAIGAYYFVAGFHRSLITLPYVTEHREWSDAADDRRYHSDWWWLNLAFALALSLALVAIAAGLRIVLPAQAWLAAPLMLGAAITPPLLAADFVRRWFYKQERAWWAAAVSALFFVALVAGAAVAARLRPDAAAGTLAWGMAATLATVFALAMLRPARPAAARAWARFAPHARFAGWLALNIFPYTVYSTATVVILIGALLGPGAAAVFTAARTLTNPAVSIVSAIDSTDKPRAAAALATGGGAGLRRAIGNTRRTLIVLTGGYLALVALFAHPLIALIFHGQYAGVERDVQLLCAAFFLFCLNQPSETLLIVLRASRTMFATRAATALVTLAALIVAIPYGVAGMAVAIALSQLANIMLLGVAERHALRRHILSEVPA
ncbi:O-antigen/teichoic acid export membrane protein [Sphingomonas sp. BE138]|uniref:lipopolysaccharide biosynthesis protein n=1 Tax=Sphingomonas sp. BE138 TaxID=2817845 RepID=UPI00285ADC7B|nr:hypothetical protein [Sphingomonas sp. BE138]MDR6788487.1 O-antigen/teichoic acid export membrane protein [Sphingomonas sp. BE138]